MHLDTQIHFIPHPCYRGWLCMSDIIINTEILRYEVDIGRCSRIVSGSVMY